MRLPLASIAEAPQARSSLTGLKAGSRPLVKARELRHDAPKRSDDQTPHYRRLHVIAGVAPRRLK